MQKLLYTLLLCMLSCAGYAQDSLATRAPRVLAGLYYGVGISGFVGPGTLSFENQVHPFQGGIFAQYRLGKCLGVGLEVNRLTQGARANAYGTQLIQGVSHQQVTETNYRLGYLQVPLHAVGIWDEYHFRLRVWAGPYWATLLNAECEQVVYLKTLVPGRGQHTQTRETLEIEGKDIEGTELGVSLGASLDVPVYRQRCWVSGQMRYTRAFTQFNINNPDIPSYERMPHYYNSTLQLGLGLYWNF
ncbi:MAG: outer membrane beta-barrel protein [Bacteroidetes bacterium]|nr:outer membrane beta-barrel protein [Bacteroidota bacterium]